MAAETHPPVAPAQSRASAFDRPGLRTLRSRGFRTTLAVALLVIGLGVLGSVMLRQAERPDGQFAIDFADYHSAARRIAAGESPYSPDMLSAPIPAQGQDRYRYPPPFAQLLVPLSMAPPPVAATIWLTVQAIAVLGAVWLAGTVGGAERTAERFIWSAVAATYFLPVFDTLWKGNVSGIIALSVAIVALPGAAAFAGAASAAMLKVAPVTLVPSSLVALSHRARLWGVGVLIIALVISYFVSPSGWSDYLIVLPNLLAGSVDYANNLAPAAMATHLGAPAVVGTIIRFATIAVAVVAVVVSMTVVRRRRARTPLAAAAGTMALLLLPSALWYHYLAVLLPVAALAWPRAKLRERIQLAGGAAAITVGLAWLPLALAGATAMVAGALSALWNERVTTAVDAQ